MRSGCASSAPHPFPNLPPDLIGAIDPHALKIPAPKGRNTRYPETATLHFRLNQDITACRPRRNAAGPPDRAHPRPNLSRQLTYIDSIRLRFLIWTTAT